MLVTRYECEADEKNILIEFHPKYKIGDKVQHIAGSDYQYSIVTGYNLQVMFDRCVWMYQLEFNWMHTIQVMNCNENMLRFYSDHTA